MFFGPSHAAESRTLEAIGFSVGLMGEGGGFLFLNFGLDLVCGDEFPMDDSLPLGLHIFLLLHP